MEQEHNEEQGLRRWPDLFKRIVPSVYYFLTALCVGTILLFLLTVFYRPCRVDGVSMVPTLQHGDLLILSCQDSVLQRGEIVAISREGEPPLIKRVIAVGGDTVRIDQHSGKVYVNGAEWEEPYLNVTTPCIELKGEVTVPAGHLFVMGDNRAVSHDSRYEDIGFVDADDVIGTATYRLLPFSEKGAL